MSHDPIRVGVIGQGFWATTAHLPVLHHLPQYEPAAVASRDASRAQQTARRFGIPRVYGDVARLIDDPEIDLVAILTPAPTHAVLARAAIEAGKDVYVEWPLTTSSSESAALLESAETAGVRHLVGLQRRMGPSIRYARDLVRQGYVGQIRGVRISVGTGDFGFPRPSEREWTLDPDNFTHLLSVYGGHFLDTLFQIVGPPVDVSAVTQHVPGATGSPEATESVRRRPVDEVMMTGTLQRGGLFGVHIEGAQSVPTGLSIDITGTDGVLHIRNDHTFAEVDNTIHGASAEQVGLTALTVPASYRSLAADGVGQTVLDLAYLYSAYAADEHRTDVAVPTFADAVDLHRVIDVVSSSASAGSASLTVDGQDGRVATIPPSTSKVVP